MRRGGVNPRNPRILVTLSVLKNSWTEVTAESKSVHRALPSLQTNGPAGATGVTPLTGLAREFCTESAPLFRPAIHTFGRSWCVLPRSRSRAGVHLPCTYRPASSPIPLVCSEHTQGATALQWDLSLANMAVGWVGLTPTSLRLSGQPPGTTCFSLSIPGLPGVTSLSPCSPRACR